MAQRLTSSHRCAPLPQFWAGIAAAGLFLPSPEALENLLHNINHAALDPVEIVNAAAAAAKTGTGTLDSVLQGGLNLQDLQNPSLDPSTFVPVCQFSDTFYRSAQKLVLKLAGRETYQVCFRSEGHSAPPFASARDPHIAAI